MMWREPKTDWASGDAFNIWDYNRIKGNVDTLRVMALQMWPDFPFEDMGEDKTYQDVSFYADEINKFEKNLEFICNNTYPFPIGEKQLFTANAPFISSTELNRIESACLYIHEILTASTPARETLEFTLNGGIF